MKPLNCISDACIQPIQDKSHRRIPFNQGNASRISELDYILHFGRSLKLFWKKTTLRMCFCVCLLPLAPERGEPSRHGHEPKWSLRIIGTEYWSHGQHPCPTLVRHQLFPALIMVSLAMTAKPLMLSGGLYNERVGTQTTLSCIAHAREVEFEKSIAKLYYCLPMAIEPLTPWFVASRFLGAA